MTEPVPEPDPRPEPGDRPPADPGDPIPLPRARGRRHVGLLADRVSRLEAAVAELEEQQATEDAVAERVLARLTGPAEPRRVVTTPGVLVDEPKTAALALVGDAGPDPEPLPLPPDSPPPPSGAVIRPPAPAAVEAERRAWFLPQLAAEIRQTFQMYFDSRYRISRTAQVMVPLIVGLFVLNYFVFAVWVPIPFVGPVLERLVGVLLGVFVYKVMTRELARYREVLDYLARFGPR